jgi:hypothetical protein
MIIPEPKPGLVIRYGYLWSEEAKSGQDEARKQRPAAIVMTVAEDVGEMKRCAVLPITHSPPNDETIAMELPAAVCKAAGLDMAQAWVVLSEYNEFRWPGFDLAPVPNRSKKTVAYGYLTSGFFLQLQTRWLALAETGHTDLVPRDE